MVIDEERIRESATYKNKVSNRKNIFEIFKSNNTMNSVTQTQIVCGNNMLSWESGEGSIHCKKEKNDDKEIPVTAFDVVSAFDFLQDRGLIVNHTEWATDYVIYALGMSTLF